MDIEETGPGNPFLKSLDNFSKTKKTSTQVRHDEGVDPFGDLPEKKKSILQRLKAFWTQLLYPNQMA